MLNALLDDLVELSDVEVLTCRDYRLSPLHSSGVVISVGQGADVWQVWEECITQVDAVWPIAPESGGVLERLSQLVLKHGKILLGSSPQTVALTASKYDTAVALSTQAVSVIPTFRPCEIDPSQPGPWVAKPDDGVGCEDTHYFPETPDLMHWLATGRRMQTHIVQPYMRGESASLSMICHAGRAWLLSCNRQRISLQQGVFSYHGSMINGMAQHWDQFDHLAQNVASLMPELMGYVGVDVMVQDEALTLIEINPRLTTSYAGLSLAVGCNPARLILDLIYNGGFRSTPCIARNVVEVSLDA